ncbi:hypothetical protein PRIC2_005870 [Phytophthora ramorum]
MQDGGTEATSLMRWLGFYAATDQEQCVVIVGRLLDTAFPAAFAEENMLRGWEAVMATLEGFYEASVGLDVRRLADAVVEPNETLRTVLELVLGAVVQCEKKDQFVKDILTMEDAVQADLMSIIERVMARGVSVVEESREGRVGVMGQTEMQEKEQKTQSSDKQAAGMGSPLYLSRNAALEQTKRENGVLKEENVHLARELDATTKTFREVEDEKLKLVEMVRQLKEQLGSDVLRKERSVHALYCERLKALQRELDHAKAELQDKTALATKVPALQDEVDLLRPLADKMAKMDTTVAKYKAKIDELSGAKDTLRSLEGTNAELMEMNLALESKLAKAASWHRKLKEAKEANTAVEFRVSELETLLARERQDLVVARADLEAAHSSLYEINALNAQLQQSVNQRLSDDTTDGSAYSAPAMTGGINEFNPELMQKLTRLEYENGELKKQVDGETATRIDGMLDEIEDMARLKKSFETKYFDTQQALQSTQSELKLAKHAFDDTTADLQARIDQLTRMVECSTMQVEDVNAERLRFQQLKAHELREVRHRYEEQAADTIEQTTLLVDAKSSEIEQLTSRLLQDKTRHDAERQELESTNLAMTTELERYQELHSVSNTDWCAKERELNDRVRGLEELCSQWKQQEQVLKSTIKIQLQSNGRIVEKNKALKANVIDKREAILNLEATNTRLESKVALLEKERAHFSTQEERKRAVGSGISSFSTQLSTQVSLVVTELEKVLKENKELHQKLVGCRCGRGSPPRGAVSDSAQKAKNYYLSRIQQLEHSKQQGEHKRRELLLVNAKLIQEQKQLHVKNMSLTSGVHELEESVNHWRLREERRKKQEEQPSLPVETEYKFTSPRFMETRAKGQSRNNDPLPSRAPDETRQVSREVPVAALASVSTVQGDTRNLLDDQDNGACSSTRKRKLENEFVTPEAATSCEFTKASDFFSKPSTAPAPSSSRVASEPRSKRRLSHFITRGLASEQQQPHKPSECQQQ